MVRCAAIITGRMIVVERDVAVCAMIVEEESER